jgi:peroxiredoxin
MAITVGSAAPEVTLFTLGEKGIVKFTLTEHRGKNLLLLFYPAAFTGTCTKEMCMVQDSLNIYQALDAEVIGISPDYPASLAVWGKEHHLTMTLASDFNREAVKGFDIEFPNWGGGMIGVPIRSAFVIDKAGIVRYVHLCPTPGDIPPFDEIQKVLSTLT